MTRLFTDDKDIQRFVKYLPDPSDLTLFVLKAHLLVETTLREIVKAQCGRPSALDDAQLSFWHLVHVAEALAACEDRTPSWVWPAARTLNAVRNQLAHKLEPEGVMEKLEQIVAVAERCARGQDDSWDDRLLWAIGLLIGFLANIRDGKSDG